MKFRFKPLIFILFLVFTFLPWNVNTAYSAANFPAAGDVVINEYVANASTEWVELYNTTANALDISGYYIDDIASGGGSPKAIPASTTIAAGGYYVMTFSSFLNNGGDDVRFLDPPQTTVLDSTNYTSSTSNYSYYRTPDGGAWSPTESSTPTQGTANPGGGGPSINPGDVVVNEYVANATVEWVELYNTTGSDLDISGYYIDDVASGGGAPQAIPASTTILAGGFYTMDLSSYLNNGGDDVRLIDPAQTTVIDSTSYTFSTNGYSWYRSTNGGAWSPVESDAPTKNSSNTPAAGAGDVLINEFVANAATEWVELYNTTLTALDISGYYIDDIAAGGGSPKAIPADTIIPAGGYYVLQFSSLLNNGGDDVRFLDPTQTTVLDAYTYGSATADYSWYRFPDGGTWSGVQSATPTPGATNPGTGDTPWVAGTFEIRIFDVEQGDSQLIIFPSGYTILIDVREASWNTGAGAALIATKIRAITGGSYIDVGLISHQHLDHMGYAGYGGIWGLIENEGITFGKLIDRDSGTWVDGSGGGVADGVCDPDLEIVWNNAGTQSGTARNWLCYATNSANTNIFPIREIAILNSTTQIDPPDAGAIVEIVQVDADSVTKADGVTPLQGDHTGEAVPPSENDYSTGLKITFGSIDYATAGDSDGEYATSSFGYSYNDVETVIAPRFGQVDIMRANHHGSGHSTSQYYVDTLNPDVSAVSCGNNSYGHPDQRVIDALLATSDVYFTNMCDATRNYGASVLVNGDIIIQSTDGVNYTVNGTAYVASSNATPTPTPAPTPTATPAPAADVINVSSTSSGTAGGVSFKDEDIIAYDTGTGTWSMVFDGSDVGVTVDLNGFQMQTDGSILMSFQAPASIGGLGTVDDSDIVRFVPTSLGTTTAGTFEWYFDGSDVGLSANAEDIDAIYLFANGDILISTVGNFSAGGVSGKDEDLYRFNPSQLGATTSGSWSFYFDGSDVSLSTANSEDVNGGWIDEATGEIYLTTLGAFSVSGVSGDGADIFICAPSSTGATTACTFTLYWDGSANGMSGEILDGFSIEQ